MILAVDFGTVHTVGAFGRSPRLVTVDGAPWMPSAVYAGDDGLVVGVDAVELGRGSGAARFERTPKTRVAAGTLTLGGRAVPVADAVRAVLERVVAAARAQGGPVDELVLTHPVSWGEEEVTVLLAAAAGLAPSVRPVAEPVAAAAALGLAAGETVLVVDLGAAACEVAVVRREPAGFAVLASAGLPDVGGDAFDARIVERVRPSLRAPLESPRDRQLLLDSARAGKELLSRHESTEIVLPDHRAVRLDRAEFEQLVGGDVEKVVEKVAALVAGLADECERVVLVGGASRVPLVARRLAESTGRPVAADPEPETAVARGALLLAGGTANTKDTTGTPDTTAATGAFPRVAPAEAPAARTAPPPASAPASVPPSAPRRRGRALATLGLVVALVVAAAVLLTGSRETSGRAVAGTTFVPEPSLPPVPAGVEAVTPGEPQFTPARVGDVGRYDERASGVTLGVRLDGYATAMTSTIGEPPPGHRWLAVQFSATNIAGPDWRGRFFDLVGALDDRGQWLRPVGDAQVPCEGRTEQPDGVNAGEEAALCGVLPVPAATLVVAIVFGDPAGQQAPLRFPVSVPAAATAPAPANVVGTVGGPAVATGLGGVPLRERVDLVLAPSAYLAGRAPRAGSRFVVVRAVLTVTGTRDLTDTGALYLRDDRGALLGGVGAPDAFPGCRPPMRTVAVGRPAWGCYLFEIDADVPVTGVTHGVAGTPVAEWPTWTV